MVIATLPNYIEVFAAHRPPHAIVIFYYKALSDLCRHLLDERK